MTADDPKETGCDPESPMIPACTVMQASDIPNVAVDLMSVLRRLSIPEDEHQVRSTAPCAEAVSRDKLGVQFTYLWA